jgi:hypothetical protein
MSSYTLPQTPVDTVGANSGNEITEAYYWFLVGEITRGTIRKAVCRIESARFGHTRYHLISI